MREVEFVGVIDEKKQNKIIVTNSLYSVFFKILSYILTFLTTPLLISCLGDVKYGIYTTALSIVSWIYYFDFGIGSGLRNKVTETIIKEDYDTAHKSVNVAYIIVTCISLSCYVVVFAASFFFDFDKVLNAGLSDENLNVITVIAIFLACINFVFSLSKNLLWALQKTALVDGLAIVSKLFWLVALWIYSRTGSSSMLVVVVLEGISEFLKNVSAMIYIKKKHPVLSPTVEKPDMAYSKGIFGFGLQIFLMQISALVLNATDNIIIMHFFSAAEVTPYSLGHKYFSMLNVFFSAATGSLWTAYTTAYTMKDTAYIKKTIQKSLMFYLVTVVGMAIAYSVYFPFMKVYLGRELGYQNGQVLLIAVYYAILIFSHNFSSFVHGIGKVRLTTVACVISALLNIPCSVFFATKCGMKINGVILGSIVSLLISTPCYIYTTFKEIRKMGN